jgi:hypothetical protein
MSERMSAVCEMCKWGSSRLRFTLHKGPATMGFWFTGEGDAPHLSEIGIEISCKSALSLAWRLVKVAVKLTFDQAVARKFRLRQWWAG